jgi:hypothetical protein
MFKRIIVVMVVLLAFTFAMDATEVFNCNTESSRAVPKMLNYQGFLTDTLGVPVNASSMSMTFGIWSAVNGGSQLWYESQNLSISQGIFSTLLGSIIPIPDSVFSVSDRWLELTIAGITLTPRTRIVSVGYSYTSTYTDTADFARNATASSDSDWTINGNIMYPAKDYGLSMHNGNMLYGDSSHTHVCFGIACTTGMNGYNRYHCTISGGNFNTASGHYASVSGGLNNSASGLSATVAGGRYNTADGEYATVCGGHENNAGYTSAIVGGGVHNTASGLNSFVGGGYYNTASADNACVGGGANNNASYSEATIGGGSSNIASSAWATVSGGGGNTASGYWTTVGGGAYNTAYGPAAIVGGGYNNEAMDDYTAICGGSDNIAWGNYATVGGGFSNAAWNHYATVAGGYADTAAAEYSFSTNYSTNVIGGHNNSAAFTTSHTTAANQVRAAAFSTGTLVFTMDHPSDPMNKILNQHAVGSPIAMLIYCGSIVLDAKGSAVVYLPDYFSDINMNPLIQLTGIGSSDVYVAEEVTGNRFVIAGKPYTKVYWQVTGERKDIHAEIARIQTPVVQQKTGALIGHSLDDDALIGIYDDLQHKQPGHFIFRTDEGRRAHMQSVQRPENKDY